MSNFLDQQPWTVSEADLKIRWGGGPPGARLRCYLCGHCFQVGDVARFVFDNDAEGVAGGGLGNFIACATCDGPDVRQRWWALCAELKKLKEKFWWYRGGIPE